MKKLVTLLFAVGWQFLFSQPDHAGARSIAMGNANVVFTDSYSLLGNQSGLAFTEKMSALVSVERRFMLSEIQSLAAGIALPTKSGCLGLTMQRFGFEGFRQQKLGLIYARKLFQNFSIGSEIDYFQTRIPDYGSKGLLSFEIGLMAKLGKQFLAGTHLSNPVKIEMAEGQSLPTIFKFGLAFLPSEKATAIMELEKDIDFPLRIKGGFEYCPVDVFCIRAGFSSNPSTIHIGMALRLNQTFRVDTSGSFHQPLGFSPAGTVIFTKP
jgi:hypothetical protein